MAEETPAPKKEKFLKKAERTVCYGARDQLWACLDKEGGDQQVCAQFKQMFTKSCPPSWVTHFTRKYDYEKFKDRLKKEGYQKVDSDNIKKTESEQSNYAG